MKYHFNFYMSDGSRPVSLWTTDHNLAADIQTFAYKQGSTCYFVGPFHFVSQDDDMPVFRVDMTKVLMFSFWEEQEL